MIRLMTRWKFAPTLAFFSPFACVGYIVSASIVFGEHTLFQKLGITVAALSLGPTLPLSVLGYRIRSIPKDWTVSVINESTMNEKCYKHAISEGDKMLLPYAKSKSSPHPLIALMKAGEDCGRLKQSSHNGEVVIKYPGKINNKMLSAGDLSKLESDVGIMPISEDEIADGETTRKRMGA